MTRPKPSQQTFTATMLVMLAALLPTAAQAQEPATESIEQPLPAAEVLLDGMVEAVGGVEAFEAVDTVVSKGSMELSGIGIGGSMTIYQAKPGLSRSDFNAEGLGSIAQGTNGEIAWEVSLIQGPRLLAGDEKAFAERAANIDANVLWREHFDSAETVGTAVLDEATCFLVKMTPKEGNPETWWIDQSSMRVVKVELTLKLPLGEFPVEFTLGDYREVGGIMLPFRSTQKVMGQEMVTLLDEIKINSELDDSIFDLPQEIADLVAGDTDEHEEAPKVVEEPGSGMR